MTDSPDLLDTAEPGPDYSVHELEQAISDLERRPLSIDAVLLLLSLFASLAVATSLLVRIA